MRIRAVAARQKGLLAAGVLVGLAGTAAMLLQPVLLGRLIANVSAGESATGPVVGIALLFVADAVLATLNVYLIGLAGENMVLDMRTTLTGRLLRSRLEAFRRLEHGDVMNRTLADTSLARLALSSSVAQMVTSAFTVVGCVVAMAWIDWRLLLAALACLGLAAGAGLLLAGAVRRAATCNREDTSAYGSGLLRVLGALTTVKASRAEDREGEHLAELAGNARRSGIRVTRLSAMFLPAINVGTQLSLAVVITWGIARTATGTLQLADLTAFVMYLFYLVSPLVLFFMGLGEVQQGRAAIARVVELADLEQEEDDGRTAIAGHPRAGAPAVEFRDVGFRYEGAATPAVDGVSFTLPATGVTAVVGPSGAGKSTVFQLVERFMAPDQGSVRLLGQDAGDVSLAQWRSRIALVEQDCPLMRGTLRENLVYACPDADDEQVRDAVRAAHLEDVVAALPDGLDTRLGEAGVGLSGGQRQRLAVARALLTRPSVLLLDEATSQLDSDSERALRETVTSLGDRCQVITVAHRMSTAMSADHILVMEGGRLRAQGPHARLMDDDELYRRLADQQLSPVALAG
ncbi:ATP-binding cassette domain-containing protein [Modestobacter sp. I12A-02628]|uniref:ABC transporter ATP-binding protein n=1 Tax=Goekera deserti TaxID=2497753 RepID=A0A7K3WC18_9ACTN|nr:ABC transporter ATP-binding protein [Goekera deserti]MPQ98768.1 ATP-binding cassette domain-containing protein [Goekera deserti]NDI49734.1 ATP-binding cassette domain-containing protein [Goekera deserti]NEL53073.1 ABC transporter ATP-binding protein [Goekera deserti]